METRKEKKLPITKTKELGKIEKGGDIYHINGTTVGALAPTTNPK